jgi:hypothetical protein
MVASEIKKFDLGIFVLVDVGVRRLIVGNMVEGHPGSLPSQLIADERETGAIQGRPYFFDIIMIGQVWLPDGERIECDSQNTLKRA